jgi:hypothetical protein
MVWWSPAKEISAVFTCFRLAMHLSRLAFLLALASVGRSMLARMPMIAITTNSSISVNALFLLVFILWLGLVFRVVEFARGAASSLFFLNV